ncbi:MAG: SpoIVB peptidase [Clostridia bacterium]|nr:SpoIVB peptidase [Clostridia bacterium]
MRFISSYRKKFVIFLAVCFTVMSLSYIRTLSVVPAKIVLLEGEEFVCDFKSPFLVNISADRQGVLKLNNGEINTSGNFLSLSSPISLKSQRNGSVNLKIKIFGLLPLKTMRVDVVPNKRIVACGNTIGVKLKVNGVLVIGLSDVETEDGKSLLPARDGGLRPGDLIVEVDNQKLESIDDLVRMVEKSNGKQLKLKYKRGGSLIEASVYPVKAMDDKKYHLGVWVRDSTAGIGTLTFYDPENKRFGALGHGITDIDTGALMPIESGEILESNILAIKKGRQGSPGELKGVFVEDRNKLGIINRNSDFGIYGKLNEDSLSRIPNKTYPIALHNQVKEGPATILANIDGKTVEEYSVEIQKVSKQNINSSKGMIIRITDPRLLDTTGGIVQGMSGSPIIQNDRVVGAVTHVLVNDPTRGYGIFIEWMVQNTMEENQNRLEKVS